MERFDEQMRLRAQREPLTASPQARKKLAAAMQAGRQTTQRTWHRPIFAAGAALAVVILQLVFIQPPLDPTPQAAILAQPDEMASPVPVTEIEARMELALENRELHATATFANHTGDIWLIRWWAQPECEMQVAHQPTKLIWLETGITFEDCAEWLPMEQTACSVNWGYEAYRVSASVLHWLDGDWLLPGQEGYEEQQDLIEEAFQTGALILCVGDWPDGTSGEMQLVLPDSQKGVDPIPYYVQAGCIELATTQQQTATLME